MKTLFLLCLLVFLGGCLSVNRMRDDYTVGGSDGLDDLPATMTEDEMEYIIRQRLRDINEEW
jgi:hypothetical protein